MTRRQFAFWLGMFLFWLSERANASFIDSAAAGLMGLTEPKRKVASDRERWRANENRSWQWFERRTLIDGNWKVTGITTPINKATGAPYTEKSGYLDDRLVPDTVRHKASELRQKLALAQPDASRRAQGGRPPSQWLRSLEAHELRIWLKTIDVPPAGVSGMTFWTHLTRDHSFEAERLQGLTVSEQAKLHAAAHYGY